MDLTIITPNLNGAAFLEECLASVAAQEGVVLEHRVMDGGSTDASADIAARFSGVIWTSRPDEGMSDAINRGFDLARGDWVMWLNSDDRLKPGALAAMMAAVRGDDRSDVVYGTFDFVSREGSRIKRMRLFGWSPFVSIHHCCYVPSTACVFRRSTIIDHGFRLRKDFHYVMDGEFFARLHQAEKRFRYVPRVLADFRLHGANASMRHLNPGRDMDLILEAERQHVESRAIRRAFGITLFADPYLNGLADGVLWLLARMVRCVRRWTASSPADCGQEDTL